MSINWKHEILYDEGLELFYIYDSPFTFVQRPDGIFLVYKQNENADGVDYQGIKLNTLQECESYLLAHIR